jgi:cytochrome c-type biogenesis protein CcmH/NrfF
MNRALLVAFSLVATLAVAPAVAYADDFEAQCTAQDKSPESVKSCKCASDKLTGGDRAAALEAMKAVNTALASGKAEDAAVATQKNAKGIEIIMTAQASCM